MLEPDLSKSKGTRFKHEITAQLRGISPIWTVSQFAHDVGRMWMSPTLEVGGSEVGVNGGKLWLVIVCF